VRRPNEELINAVHQIYAEGRTRTIAAVADELERRNFGRRAPSTIRYWRAELRRRRLLDEHDVSHIAPLWPAYLLIDVPPAAAREVARQLRAIDPQVQLEQTQGLYSLIARTHVGRPTALPDLVDRCIAGGAFDARAVLVLREAV
jgi:hypothetical protein